MALTKGATAAGADVTQIGLISTDCIYFAVGHYGFDGGIMITASHNPAQYNGLKFSREDAIGIALDTGLAEVRDLAAAGAFRTAARVGTVKQPDMLDAFAEHCLSFINDVQSIKPLRIAIDAGNGLRYPDWWMNIRASNTEPLLRLNVEGDTKALMQQRRDEALALIRA